MGVDWPTAVVIALTLAAVLLAAVAILLAIGGLIGYFDFRSLSKKRAESTAAEMAKAVAILQANAAAESYIQLNLRAIVKEYIEIVPPVSGAASAAGDQIAQAESSDDPPV